MSNDEDDYMSDKFLANISDVRPSLVHNHSKKRQLEVESKKAQNLKRQKEEQIERSDERRNERLQTSLGRPIEADNKGFQLLAKMGYKPGSTLGSGNNSNAIKEPIGITLKSNRAGLGREAALQELAAKRAELQRQHLLRRAGLDNEAEISTEAYRLRATQKAEERKVIFDLKRCQQTCETLDNQAELEAPELEFFWPIREQTDILEGDDSEDKDKDNLEINNEEPSEELYSNVEKLDLLTSYLRTAYKFCYWCGTRYESEKDLADCCPGLTSDDH